MFRCNNAPGVINDCLLFKSVMCVGLSSAIGYAGPLLLIPLTQKLGINDGNSISNTFCIIFWIYDETKLCNAPIHGDITYDCNNTHSNWFMYWFRNNSDSKCSTVDNKLDKLNISRKFVYFIFIYK